MQFHSGLQEPNTRDGSKKHASLASDLASEVSNELHALARSLASTAAMLQQLEVVAGELKQSAEVD